MPFLDLRDFVLGVLTIIFISIGIGQFGKLHDFSKREAVKTLRGWPAYHFFPPGYDERKIAK